MSCVIQPRNGVVPVLFLRAEKFLLCSFSLSRLLFIEPKQRKDGKKILACVVAEGEDTRYCRRNYILFALAFCSQAINS